MSLFALRHVSLAPRTRARSHPPVHPQELNAHRQTREETLQRAADIFGADNAHLYTAFEGLLTRHMPLAGGA